ncbi:MAG: PAS domain S-box protein, partial [Bacteroidota bacterium]
MNKGRNPKFEDLRQKAEELLGNKPSHLPVNPSEADSLKLIHELEVHQIEMEVLNDELMLAKEKAEVAAKRNLELFDFAPAGYFSLHPDGSIIELNLSAARMLGKKRSQLKNSRLGFFVSDDTKPIFNNFLEKTFNSNATKECEVTLSLSAESPKVVTLTGIVADKGDQCIVNMVDITQRKQAEKEKQISDALIRTLSLAIEQSPVTTVITDLAGNIEFVNPKFTEITGYTAEEVIGKNPRVLKSGDKPDSKYQELWDTILSGQSWHGIFQNKKKSGELYWESAVISPVKDEKGVITHFLAVKEDITERRQAEEEIKLKNEELH